MKLPMPLKAFTKCFSCLAAMAVFGLSLWTFIKLTDNDSGTLSTLQGYILAADMIIMAIILVLSEFELAIIEEKFALVANLFGRGIYILVMGSLFLNSSYGYSLATGICLMVIGGMYTLLYCFFNEEAKRQEQINDSLPNQVQASIK